mmetsp:Transcript_13384/g.46599  ORF Transcript_13384/g.46599 Transcript_13384/m.46599 type:complete len:234 (-) Transcript_13384:32-733(-)
MNHASANEIAPTAKAIIGGARFNASAGSTVRRSLEETRKRIMAKAIEINGAKNHCSTMPTTPPQEKRLVSLEYSQTPPSETHKTPDGPLNASIAPTMPPRTACVVETGMALMVASVTYETVPIIAQSMRSCSSSGFPTSPSPLGANFLRSTMPLRIVCVTAPDMDTAPRTFITAAMQKACRIVMTPEPTLVPKAFATSFAPMHMAMRKQTMKPSGTSQSVPMAPGATTPPPSG